MVRLTSSTSDDSHTYKYNSTSMTAVDAKLSRRPAARLVRLPTTHILVRVSYLSDRSDDILSPKDERIFDIDDDDASQGH